MAAGRFLLAALSAATVVAAPHVRAQDARPPRPDVVLVDRIVATVGDAAILQSRVIETAAGELRSRQQELGRPLEKEERAVILRTSLERLIDQHAMAQAAKTLGVIPPSQVEAIFQHDLAEAEREQVRQFGSYQKLSEEFARRNLTWAAFERDQRLERMSELTEQMAVYSRISNQQNLFITPRMMLELYKENVQAFVYGPRVTLGVVAFVGLDDANRTRAAEAAALWRTEPLRAAELASRFPDHATAQKDVVGLSEETKDKVPAFLADFGLKSAVGTVSEPAVRGSTLFVAKVLEVVAGRNGRFEDPEVQAQLRTRLEGLVLSGMRRQAVARSRMRTHTWYADGTR